MPAAGEPALDTPQGLGRAIHIRVKPHPDTPSRRFAAKHSNFFLI